MSAPHVDLRDLLRITDAGRWSLDAEYERQGALLESERDVIRAGELPGIDLTEFRTLSPQTEQAQINGTYNRTILNDVSATVNASSGVPTISDCLAVDTWYAADGLGPR